MPDDSELLLAERHRAIAFRLRVGQFNAYKPTSETPRSGPKVKRNTSTSSVASYFSYFQLATVVTSTLCWASSHLDLARWVCCCLPASSGHVCTVGQQQCSVSRDLSRPKFFTDTQVIKDHRRGILSKLQSQCFARQNSTVCYILYPEHKDGVLQYPHILINTTSRHTR